MPFPPAELVAPMLQQALADFAVAEHLSSPPPAGESDVRPAYDAALAKYQQALEKALKACLLQFAPHDLDLHFGHVVLDFDATGLDETALERAKHRRDRARAALGKLFNQLRDGQILARLHALESLAPRGFRLTAAGEFDDLAPNTEYPYELAGRVVAPCVALRPESVPAMIVRKDLRTLFNLLRQRQEFDAVFGDRSC